MCSLSPKSIGQSGELKCFCACGSMHGFKFLFYFGNKLNGVGFITFITLFILIVCEITSFVVF